MSADLLEQLAQYGADHRARQVPVERHEILERVHELTDAEDELLDDTPPARPRFLLVAAAAAVIVMVAGVAFVIGGRDSSDPSDVPGTDLIRSTEPSLPSTTVESSPTRSTSTTSTTAPPREPEATEAVVLPSIEASASLAEGSSVAGVPFREGSRSDTLGAWDDGFLYVSVVGGFQQAVELSDEMFSRLPPEVREAYPEQLEGTLGEVIGRLQADGLLDEVQAALEADPDLEEAVLSGAFAPVEFIAEYTIDGETWTPVGVSMPPDVTVAEVFIVGSRLVAVGTPRTELSTSPFQTMIVASTHDLDVWFVQTVPDVVETLGEVSVAANDRGWVAHIEPDSCRIDDDGNGFECASPGRPGWGYDIGDGPALTWAAEWDGVPIAAEGPVAAEGVIVTALQTGFVAQGDEILHSADGLTWTSVIDVPQDLSVGGALPLDDGSTIVFGSATTCTTEMYRVDENGRRWEHIDLEIDGAGTTLMPDTGGLSDVTVGNRSLRTSAVLVDDRSGPNVSIGVLERDGFRLTRTNCSMYGRSHWNYELVDVASGAVISAEQATRTVDGTRPIPDWEPFEHLLLSDDEDDVVLDPVTGDELMVFARDEMGFTDIGYGGSEDVWLLTTVDGLEWRVDDLTDFGGTHFVATARNGDIALVGSGDKWLRYELSSD